EDSIGLQIMHVKGPIARTIKDLRLSLAAMSGADPRDPWSVPAPLEGPSQTLRAALCVRPGGMQVAREVEEAVRDAGLRLADAGWTVEEMTDTPPWSEAAEVNEWLWLGDGFTELADAVERDGDSGALALIANLKPRAKTFPADVVARALVQRATV